ncbi:MAG: hypothetical protein JXB45_01360 [Candidatus Krumholzibacteriota bacterium]|nr:hypothetical protein [Candidatus Krumholzibacteriota bacterium]
MSGGSGGEKEGKHVRRGIWLGAVLISVLLPGSGGADVPGRWIFLTARME